MCLWSHTKVLTGVAVDDVAGFTAVEEESRGQVHDSGQNLEPVLLISFLLSCSLSIVVK